MNRLTGTWRTALTFGVAIALLHRLALTAWLALAWGILGLFLPSPPADFHATPDARLPALASPLEASLFGPWRRWDAVHYLDLATNGYRLDQAGSTVFGPLVPLALAAVAPLAGGSVDAASVLVQTLAFAAVLTLLIRFCAIYFEDAALGVAAAIMLALLPLSFYFAAPLSESVYLACALGAMLAAAQRRWLIAALVGLLAALTRAQGAVIAGAIGLMLLDAYGWQWSQPRTWVPAARRALLPGLPLLLIPLGYVVFIAYRAAIGLPSLGNTYATYSYHFFVNPLEGLWINLTWIANNPAAALASLDVWFMVGSFALAALALRFPKHRRLPLIAFTALHLLVYVSKINWVWGTTDQVLYSQSFARYSLVLFPLVILLADGARRLPRLAQVALGTISGALLLLASALFTVALIGP